MKQLRAFLGMVMMILIGVLSIDPAGQAQNMLDYLFPKIPAYRTDGPLTPPKFVIKVPLPIVPVNLNFYQVQPIAVNEAYVQRLVAAFDLKAAARPSRGEKWEVVEVGEEPLQQRSLTVYEASGGFSYMFDNLLFVPTDRQPKLPSEKEAYDLAIRFLMEKRLLPADAVRDIKQVHFSKPTLIERSAKDEKNLRDIVTSIEVRFPRALYGYRVRGPGSKLYVAFGEGGRIFGVTYVWRNVKKAAQTLPSIQPAGAIQLLQQGVGVLDAYPDCVRAEVTRMELVYWMEGPKTVQRVSLPVYRVEGQCVSADGKILGDFQAYAPAVMNAPFGR